MPTDWDREAQASPPECPRLLEWAPGVIVPELVAHKIQVWLVELDGGMGPFDDVDTAEPGAELELLSPDERVRGARFIRARDRRRFVWCRAALRQILGALLAMPAQLVPLRAGGQGKPEIEFDPSVTMAADWSHWLRFNVSHSAELGLIGVCRGREIGVDLEKVRALSEATRIVASFFSAEEQAEFSRIPPDQQASAFTRGWTRKEAVLKGLGVGLAGLAAHYETGFGTHELRPEFAPASPSPRVKEWRLWEAAVRPGFVAAVAVHEPGAMSRD
jgi:4'-phosphopantetheinyl transferase